MSIHIENLSFAYGDRQILKNISMYIEAGEKIGIIGASGSGKSTLMKLIAGLYSPQNGSIELCGARRPEEIRRNVAMVMQNPMLFPASIKENITCGHFMSDELIWQACEAARMTEWILSLPQKLDSFVGERGSKVSGGQAQRIAIARAIAKAAPVILLDEATSALDDDTAGAVLAALESLTRDKTVVSISHRLETLTGCNRIYRLEGGRLSVCT
ncbi:MAG: ABC transporter ATP-binding protein [Clostridiales bacterium]|nr:ABC transporter ATP-binding protein [Clostridiales bacterium]